MLASHFSIPRGDPGTLQTVAHMKRLVNESTGVPLVRSTAAAIAVANGTKGLQQARGIRAYLDERTIFLRDPRNRELLHSPELLLQSILRQGYAAIDCDDVAILGAAVGKSIGLRARFVVVGFSSPAAPFRHVWTELADPAKPVWVDMDTTRPYQVLPATIGRALAIEV